MGANGLSAFGGPSKIFSMVSYSSSILTAQVALPAATRLQVGALSVRTAQLCQSCGDSGMGQSPCPLVSTARKEEACGIGGLWLWDPMDP